MIQRIGYLSLAPKPQLPNNYFWNETVYLTFLVTYKSNT